MSATTQLILIVCFFFFVLTSKFSPHCHPCRSSLIGKDGLRFFSSLLQIFALAFSFSPLALPLPHLALLLLLPILPRAQVAAANPAFSKMVVVFSFLCKVFMAFFSFFSSSSIFLSSRLACQQPILPTATSLSTAYKLIRSLPSNAPVQPISHQLLLNCFITQTTMKSQSNL